MRQHLHRERGATMLVVLVMLILLGLMTLTAYKMASTNQTLVSNSQFRQEAESAVDRALEQGDYTDKSITVNGNAYAVDFIKNSCVSFREFNSPEIKAEYDLLMNEGQCPSLLSGSASDSIEAKDLKTQLCTKYASMPAETFNKYKQDFKYCAGDAAGDACNDTGSGIVNEQCGQATSSAGAAAKTCYFVDYEVQARVTDTNGASITIAKAYTVPQTAIEAGIGKVGTPPACVAAP